MKKILIIDNTLDKRPDGCFQGGGDFIRYLAKDGFKFEVRRGPQADLPHKLDSYSHVILSGSRSSCIHDEGWALELIRFIQVAADHGLSLLGVCFGHQMIARAFGGVSSVGKAKNPEVGWTKVHRTKERSRLLEGLALDFYSYQSHFEEVFTVPSTFKVTAENERCKIQAIEHAELPIYGVQFHPERTAQEGERSIQVMKKKKGPPLDCIFNEGQAQSLYSEHVAKTIFRNFCKTL